jgi:hypothetical protein
MTNVRLGLAYWQPRIRRRLDSDIINDVTAILYGQRSDRISAREVIEQYKRYLAWRVELPNIIGDIEVNKSQPLPHVLSLL